MVYFLTFLLFLPTIFAIGLLFLKKGFKIYGYIAATIELALALFLYFKYDVSIAGMQFMEQYNIVSQYGVNYSIGVDGISLFLVIITTLITLMGVYFLEDDEDLKISLALLLVLETIFLGVFLSLNAAIFYIFWELMLFPLFFSFKSWNSKRAVVSFFFSYFISSILLLVSFGVIAYIFYKQSSIISFSIIHWYALIINPPISLALFGALVVAFLLKVPFIPFFSWVKVAFYNSSLTGSLLLISVMIMVAFYAILRVAFPIFPDGVESFLIPIAIFSSIILLYLSFAIFKEKNFKNIIFYKSIFYPALIILYLFLVDKTLINISLLLFFPYISSIGIDFFLLKKVDEKLNSYKIENRYFLAKFMPRFLLLFLINSFVYFLIPLLFFIDANYIDFNALSKETLLVIFSGFFALVLFIGVIKFVISIFFRKKEGKVEFTFKDLTSKELIVPLVVIITIFLASFNFNYFQKPIQKSSSALVDFMHKKIKSVKSQVR